MGKIGFCNPPYGHGLERWVSKAYHTHNRHASHTIVMLLPARTDTRWFHEYIYGKAEIRFLRGRLHYNDAKDSAPFASMIVIFRKEKTNDYIT